MAATYVTVTELETDTLFQSDKGWIKKQTGNEICYEYITPKNKDVVIKVYSSVTTKGISKSFGKDAIRICAVNTKTSKGILKSKRVNRTLGWEHRVKDRVLELIAKIF
jgi:Na+-translocating ferredoxin:NAD+ oxidoreductase RnfG subunit